MKTIILIITIIVPWGTDVQTATFRDENACWAAANYVMEMSAKASDRGLTTAFGFCFDANGDANGDDLVKGK